MSGDDLAEILDQIDQALDHSAEKIALLEEAIRLVDSQNDVVEGFRLRTDLMSEANFGGQTEKGLVAFAWCLAKCDKDPEQFNEKDLLWSYKWMASAALGFPNISKQRVLALIVDLAMRMKRNGYNCRPEYNLRIKAHRHFGELDQVQQWVSTWKETPRDGMSDCKACDTDLLVNVHLEQGELEAGLKAAGPILSGKESCKTVPRRTIARLLLPLLELGHFDMAKKLHLRGLLHCYSGPDCLVSYAKHICYLVAVGDLKKALGLVRKNLVHALAIKDAESRLEFYHAGKLLFQKWERKGNGAIIAVFPGTFPLVKQGQRKYLAEELAAWFAEQEALIAEQFNARNGNRFLSAKLATDDKWLLKDYGEDE